MRVPRPRICHHPCRRHPRPGHPLGGQVSFIPNQLSKFHGDRVVLGRSLASSVPTAERTRRAMLISEELFLGVKTVRKTRLN